MRDFKKDSSDHLSRFGRDKRSSGTTNRATNEERRPRSQRDAADSEQPRPRRSSYNPNFTSDNRPMGSNGFEKRDGERKRFTEKRPFSGKKSYDSGSEERKSYGNGERRSYGEKREFGDRKSFGEKKSFGDKRSFSPKPSYRKKSESEDKGSYPKYDPNRQSGEMRLNRYLAQSGIASRREADNFISAGLVTVNGVVVTELGTKVQPGDEVKFNDSQVKGEKKVYLLLNKPKGYVTSLDDPHADKTVMNLVREACTERIYPVGRLDKNSLGVLLFTNDGDMTKQLTHPSHRKKKIYQVSLDKPLTRADMDSIAQGITLEDGEIYADAVSYVKENKQEVGIEIHSGRNRIVRRIFEHLGYSVQKLDRVYFAGLTKKNLKRGQWRFLTTDEVERLKSGRYE
ncbi:MAG: pseudouridine synthase [Rikenellaceae bacterium]